MKWRHWRRPLIYIIDVDWEVVLLLLLRRRKSKSSRNDWPKQADPLKSTVQSTSSQSIWCHLPGLLPDFPFFERLFSPLGAVQKKPNLSLYVFSCWVLTHLTPLLSTSDSLSSYLAIESFYYAWFGVRSASTYIIWSGPYLRVLWPSSHNVRNIQITYLLACGHSGSRCRVIVSQSFLLSVIIPNNF